MGEDLMQLLGPRPGERILDLGCGTGQLTSVIAAAGASVLGLDASPDMIGQARQNYPRLSFLLQDAQSMNFEGEFDAIFSNAALHWIPDAAAVAGNMAKALRTGGRLVLEMGGKGNIRVIDAAISHVLRQEGIAQTPASTHYFPSVSEYSSLLEQHGFEVRSAVLFDRPTALAGEDGMEQWLRQFARHSFTSFATQQGRESAMAQVVALLRPALYGSNGWTADYRRLRIVALKL